MNAALWLTQILLAIAFGLAGGLKLVMPLQELATNLPWMQHVPEIAIRLIGATELAGALGLVLPALTGIRPGLVRWAALGLVVAMMSAVGLHIIIGDMIGTATPFTLGAMAAFVAWGRTNLPHNETGAS